MSSSPRPLRRHPHGHALDDDAQVRDLVLLGPQVGDRDSDAQRVGATQRKHLAREVVLERTLEHRDETGSRGSEAPRRRAACRTACRAARRGSRRRLRAPRVARTGRHRCRVRRAGSSRPTSQRRGSRGPRETPSRGSRCRPACQGSGGRSRSSHACATVA